MSDNGNIAADFVPLPVRVERCLRPALSLVLGETLRRSFATRSSSPPKRCGHVWAS